MAVAAWVRRPARTRCSTSVVVACRRRGSSRRRPACAAARRRTRARPSGGPGCALSPGATRSRAGGPCRPWDPRAPGLVSAGWHATVGASRPIRSSYRPVSCPLTCWDSGADLEGLDRMYSAGRAGRQVNAGRRCMTTARLTRTPGLLRVLARRSVQRGGAAGLPVRSVDESIG